MVPLAGGVGERLKARGSPWSPEPCRTADVGGYRPSALQQGPRRLEVWGRSLAAGWGGGGEAELLGLNRFCIFYLPRGWDGVGEEGIPPSRAHCCPREIGCRHLHPWVSHCHICHYQVS